MKGDFSRDTTPLAQQYNFTRVLLYQGRPLSEADVNEQSYIHHRYLRMLITDLVGRAWRAGKNSFALGAGTKGNFTIGHGHYYVDGILCENATDCTFDTQPFGTTVEGPSSNLTESFLAYIECQERHRSAVQVPELLERALGGADTSSRSQVVWQVRAASATWAKAEVGLVLTALETQIAATNDADLKKSLTQTHDALADTLQKFVATLDAGFDCTLGAALLQGLDAAPARLIAMAKRDAADTDPCAIPADSQYRGRENQLYRVEIHGAGLGDGKTATFKWSRENGSVAFAIRPSGVTKGDGILTVALESLGRDRRGGLCKGDWVEVTSDAFELSGTAPPLGQITDIDRTRQSVTIKVKSGTDFTGCTLLRRWDQTVGVTNSGVIAITESSGGDTGWIELERGIQIQFQPGGVYRTGDYWQIVARAATGDIVWAKTAAGPSALAPQGVERHRAALGFVQQQSANKWAFPPVCGCSIDPMCGP